MFAALKKRLERTGAAGEILQAIGVGGAVTGFILWSAFWGSGLVPRGAAAEQVSRPGTPTHPGDAPSSNTTPDAKDPAGVTRDTRESAATPGFPARHVRLDLARWSDAGYVSKSDPRVSVPMGSIRVVESWYRVSAEISEGVDGLSLIEVEE